MTFLFSVLQDGEWKQRIMIVSQVGSRSFHGKKNMLLWQEKEKDI